MERQRNADGRRLPPGPSGSRHGSYMVGYAEAACGKLPLLCTGATNPDASYAGSSTSVSMSSGNGRCSFAASSHSAVSQVSTSSCVVRITGIAFGWIGAGQPQCSRYARMLNTRLRFAQLKMHPVTNSDLERKDNRMRARNSLSRDIRTSSLMKAEIFAFGENAENVFLAQYGNHSPLRIGHYGRLGSRPHSEFRPTFLN